MKKLYLEIIVYLVVSSVLFAQAVVPDGVYQKVDSALQSRALPDLETTLVDNAAAPWYPRLESYVLKLARQFVVQNELELAQGTCRALIDNNLDNREALDLYQSVSDAIETRNKNAERKAELARVAEFKQKMAEEKIKEDVQKTYVTVTNPETGKKVYLDQDFNNHYRSYSWDLMLGLVNLGYLSDPVSDRTRYGLSGSASVFYHGKSFSAGLDALGDLMIINLSGEPGIDWTGMAVLAGSSNAISKRLELRTGYATFGYTYGNDEVDPFNFSSPIIGLGIRDASLGQSARLKMALDYYPGHLATDDIALALGGNLLVSFIMAEMQDFSVHFQTGVRDTVLLRDSGLTNDAKLILAIGVGDYE